MWVAEREGHRLPEETGARLLGALAAIRARLDALRAATHPPALLDAAAREAAESCGFARVAVARPERGAWSVERAHFAGDDDGAAAFLAARAGLRTGRAGGSPRLRRRCLLVTRDPADAAGDDPGLLPADAPAYVAAPVCIGDDVVALLHADHGPDGRPVDAFDRELLATWADTFGLHYERAVLASRIEAQRNLVRQMVASTAAVARELCEAPVDLGRPGRHDASLARTAAVEFVAPETRLESLLTRRELEVLRLIAGGASNATIAEELVISPGTVKTHVKHVLRKLRAANRAEAVARYLHQHLADEHAAA